MAARQLFAADSANGSVDTPDGRRFGSLTRDQALQLVEYWRDQAKRNNVEPAEGWYRVATAALGYEKPGDKFRSDSLFSPAFAKSLLPVAYLPDTWDYVGDAASELDNLYSEKPPAPFAMSGGVKQRWQRVARIAWARMKKERAAAANLPLPPDGKLPQLPPPLDKPPLPQNPLKGLGTLALLVGAILILGDRS